MASHYGETVSSFSSVEGVTWQLFYDDATNYYLIASDYVENSKLPCNGNTGFGANDLLKTSGVNGSYNAAFASSSSYNDYVMTSADHTLGTGSNAIANNSLVSKYLRWIGSGLDTTANNPNMKAVAYMMDTNKWSVFAGGVAGAKAMGGPTLEMFVRSYNATHDTKCGIYWNETTNAVDITSTNANSNGYKVKVGANNWNNNSNGLDTSSDNMWVKTGSDKAYGYWLASPSSNRNSNVCNLGYPGGLYVDNPNAQVLRVPPLSFDPQIE